MGYRVPEQGVPMWVIHDVRWLRDGAQYDEDYKIAEWGQQFTVERFERARRLAEDLGVVVDELRLRKR